MITTYERGQIAGRREMLLLLLETKFGTVSPEVRQRVDAMSPEELRQAVIECAKAQSLQELHLQD